MLRGKRITGTSFKRWNPQKLPCILAIIFLFTKRNNFIWKVTLRTIKSSQKWSYLLQIIYFLFTKRKNSIFFFLRRETTPPDEISHVSRIATRERKWHVSLPYIVQLPRHHGQGARARPNRCARQRDFVIRFRSALRVRAHAWFTFRSFETPRGTLVGNVAHLRRRMYHVKQLRRRSGNSTYRELPAVGRAQADRRQGPDRDRVGARAGLTTVHVGVQDGGPGGRLMAAGTVLLALVHDDGGPQRTYTGTTMVMPREDLIDAPQEPTRTLGTVVATRTRPGFTLVDQPGLLPARRTPVLTAVGTVFATGRPADVVADRRRGSKDSATGGAQQTTSFLRRPLGLGLVALLVVILIVVVDFDDVRVRVVGHDVLFFRHHAHFTCATDLSLVRLVVGGTVVLRQDGFAAAAVLLVADVVADAVAAALGVHNRMTAWRQSRQQWVREKERGKSGKGKNLSFTFCYSHD